MAMLITNVPSAVPKGSTVDEHRARLQLVQHVAEHIIHGSPDYVGRVRALTAEFNPSPSEPAQRLAA